MATVRLVAGKGGVGKTTVTAALALHAAGRGERVLLVSTDPTGALGQIFPGVTDCVRTVAPGLEVVELTRPVVLARWRERFGEEVYRVLRSLLPVERDVLDYLEGVPGLEEEFLLSYLLDALDSGQYDRILWDATPTAGTLALLEAQALFYDHLTQAHRLYLKLQGYLKGADPTPLIEGWRILTGRILAMLRTRTRAWVVAQPERLPVVQGLELMAALERFGIALERAVLNRVLPEAACPGCAFYEARVREQRVWARRWRERSPVPVRQLPELASPPLAAAKLERLGHLLEEESDADPHA
ncbi:ArsA family ATPase [Deinococcota bacterium DY0809b]